MQSIPHDTEAAATVAMDEVLWRRAVAIVSDRCHHAFPKALGLAGRIAGATALAMDRTKVKQDADGIWSVKGKDRWYTVNGTCQCADFVQGQAPELWCKHRLAVGIVRRAGTLTPADLDTTPAQHFAEDAEAGRTPEPGETDDWSEDGPTAMEAPGIDPRFIVTIQGKPFVQYAGLLALAHAKGLQELRATWTHNDAELSLAEAVALFPFGTFRECGDATPANVGKKVVASWRRMSLTRAKGRALRDALNIGMCTVEELAEAGGAA